MAQLLDQYGKPVRTSDLTRQVSGPTMLGQRPAIITTPIGGLTPATLAALLNAADTGDSLAWLECAEELERRDLHYLGVLNTRKRTIAQLPITVTPASDDDAHKKHADFVSAWLDRGVLEKSLFDMMDAVGKGWSVHEIVWHAEAGNYYPEELAFRPPRFFEVSYQDGETIMLRDDPGCTAPPSAPGGILQEGYTALDPNAFVIHRHPSWSGLTLRAGLTRAVCWALLAKMFTMRDWGVFVQNYGLPARIGRYGPDASEEDRNVMFQALTDFGGALAAMMPKGMDFELVEPKSSGGHELHMLRAEFLNSEISKAVLGQTGTTDSKQGAHASGAIHREVQEDIERADASLLSATISQQIVARMVAFSFGPQDEYPKLRIGRPDEVPLDTLIKVVQFAGPQGLKFPAQPFYDRMGMEAPQEGDSVFGMVAQAQPVQPAHVLPAQDRPAQVMPPRDPNPTPASPQAADQQEITLHTRLGKLLSRHVRADGTHIINLMTQRLARDAEAGLAQMTDAVRAEVEKAGTMAGLEKTLAGMDLPHDQFQQAMQVALMVSELAGEAMVLDEMAANG